MRFAVIGLVAVLAATRADAQEIDVTQAAQSFRKAGEPVRPMNDSTIVCEAEEFHVDKGKGWQAKLFGTNYFAATFANAFLSRRAYLGAPEQCDESTATITLQVPKAGRYLALGLFNEEKSGYRFGIKASMADYTPAALRNEGVR